MASLDVNPIFSSRTNANNTSFNPNKHNSPFLLFVSSSAHHLSQKSIDLKTKICCAYSRHPEYIPNRIPDNSFVRVFDTTLRDGEQSPGATMTSEEKLAIARKLAKLGVDVIEAGFPASSKDDFEAVKMIAKEVGNAVDESGYVPVICGLSRCIRGDVDATWEAVKYAKRPRVHIFIATSEIHMKYKLNKTEDEIGRIVREIVSHARSLGFVDIEFSSEDAGRSDKEFLYRIFGEAIEAGATTVNFADTVGCNFPNEWGQFIADMKANIPGIENAILSTHCHNDLGLSTANTLAAVHAGARQVEVTVNGIGERAGNASLEEVVMAVKSRGKDLLGGVYTGIDTKHIVTTSKMVEEYSGLSVQPHKAIVGANAFAHASGIHQDGVLKHKGTYEIISPNDIGLLRSNEHGIVLGKLSGRHALKSRLQELGYELDGKKLDDIFLRFKAIAERKKYISDSDIESLVSDETFQPQATWKLGDMQVSCGTNGLSTATVKLIDVDGLEHIACAVGTGPVNAAYNAIDIIVKVPVTLLEYTMNSATEGIDGVASTRVVIRKDNNKTSLPEIVSGSGAGMDMVVSSARAYMNALNKTLGIKKGTSSKVSEESSQVFA